MIPLATIDGYASQIAGTPVTIVCDSPKQWGGYVTFDGLIHLQNGLCVGLQHADRWSTVNSDSAFGMLALQHEAEHYALDSSDEACVEAAAVANRWQLVRLFKLPAQIAKWIMGMEMYYADRMGSPYTDGCVS